MEKPQDDIQSVLGLEQQGRRHAFGPRVWWLGILLVVIIPALWWWSGEDDTTIRYLTSPAQRGSLTVTVSATGTLQPLNQVDVGSELSGTITRVEVDYNDEIKRGQVLAHLDTSALENRIAEGRASLSQARAKVEEARATEREMMAQLRRCRELAQDSMCSPSELEADEAAHNRAKAGVVSARAQVDMAQAVLDGYETNLTKASIRSPIDGIVLNRKVEPGQTVAASLQTPVLFTLAEDLAHMELIVAIDEADIGRIRPELTARFNVDAYLEESFPATITQIRRAPQTVDGVVSYETVLSVDNSELLLLPGMTATAEIIINTLDGALLIPNAALRYQPPHATKEGPTSVMGALLPRRSHNRSRNQHQDDGKGKQKTVWVLRDGSPQALEILVGDSDGSMTEVVGGELKAGVELITEQVAQGS